MRAFPPAVTGGVYRPLALATAAVRRGWQVTVVSGQPPMHPSAAGRELAGRIPGSVAVIRFQPPQTEPIHRLAPHMDGDFRSIDPILQACAEAFSIHPPTVVLASGPPFTEFVAALVLSRRYGSRLALDYRDEWTQSPFAFVTAGWLDRFWEHRCLALADATFFTTNSQRIHQISVFPRLRPQRAFVIENGWDESAPVIPGDGAREEDCSVISYLGYLGDHCEVGEFLQTMATAIASDPSLAELVRFQFIGEKDRGQRESLDGFREPGMIRQIDHLPQPMAQAEMRRSTALMLFNTPRLARYVPGKAYEYAAAGSDILVYGRGGEIESLLGTYPGAVFVERGDSSGLAAALSVIAHRGRSPGPPVDRRHFAETHRRSLRATQQQSILEHLPRLDHT